MGLAAGGGGVLKGGGILRAGSSRLVGAASGTSGIVRPGSAEKGSGGAGRVGGVKKVGMVVLEEGGVDLAVEARLRDLLELLPEEIRLQV
jgi:hypothetical protein